MMVCICLVAMFGDLIQSYETEQGIHIEDDYKRFSFIYPSMYKATTIMESWNSVDVNSSPNINHTTTPDRVASYGISSAGRFSELRRILDERHVKLA